MATKERQVKNSFIYMIPMAVSAVLPLLTLPIFTRILTKEDYGAWALANVYATFVAGIANFGLVIVYERNFFQHKEKKEAGDLFYSTLAFVLASSFCFGVLTYLFRGFISKALTGSFQHANLVFWSFCAATLIYFKSYYMVYFKNSERAKDFAVYTINESVLNFIFSLALIAYLRVGVMGLVWGQFLASAVVMVLLARKFFKFMPIGFDFKMLKASLKLSFPLTPRIFLKVTGSQIDKYMISLMSSVGGVGLYSIGQRVSLVIFTFMTALENVFLPQVYKRMFDHGEEGHAMVGRYLTPFVYVSIGFALGVALFSEEVIGVLTPKSYHGAIDIVIILSMLQGSLFFGKQPQLLFSKKTHIISLLTFVGIGLSIALNIPFIMKWGAVGAAWAMLLAGLLQGVIFFCVSQHYYNIKWEYKKIGLILLIFFGSSVLMILMRKYSVPYQARLMFKLLAAAGYVYMGMIYGVITKGNVELIKNAFLKNKKTYKEVEIGGACG